MPGIGSEAQLILACARTTIDFETSERIRALLREDVDWDYVIEKAEQHCIMPLLYSNLSNLCPEAVPDGVMEKLRHNFQAHVWRNLFLTRELVRVLNLLESENIPALPFKGPLLSALAYGNVSLRQFSDLDILVREQDALRAKRFLVSLGYRAQMSQTWMQKVAPRLSRKKDLVLVSADGRVRIELHWRLTGRHFSFPIDTKGFWECLDRESLAGSTVRNLPLNLLLLFLCMHGSRHGWERLAWICDIAELIRGNQNLNWETLLEQAGVLGNERNLALGLFLANDLLGVSLPEDILRRIQADPMVRPLAAQVRDLLFRGDAVARDISYWHTYHLSVRERLRDRLRLRLHYYLRYAHIAMTPTAQDEAALPLPGYLSFLYYFSRPIRLAKIYGSRSLKQLVKRRIRD